MTAPAPAELLARLAQALRAGELPGRQDAVEIAAGINRFLAGEAASLDEALGLTAAPGQRKPATMLRKERRNELLRDAARHFFPGLCDSAAAERLAARLSRYRAGQWRAGDRTKACCPHAQGTLPAALWTILKAEDRDLSERVIRRILAGS